MKRAGRLAGIYCITEFVPHYGEQPGEQVGKQPGKQMRNKQGNNPGTLIKQNETKQKDEI